MKVISFITDQQVIRRILKHLGLWTQTTSRDPPNTASSPKNNELVYEFFDDGWPGMVTSSTKNRIDSITYFVVYSELKINIRLTGIGKFVGSL
jgi:hypothetical protein